MTKSKGYEGPPSGIVPFHGICMFGKLKKKKELKILFKTEQISYQF